MESMNIFLHRAQTCERADSLCAAHQDLQYARDTARGGQIIFARLRAAFYAVAKTSAPIGSKGANQPFLYY